MYFREGIVNDGISESESVSSSRWTSSSLNTTLDLNSKPRLSNETASTRALSNVSIMYQYFTLMSYLMG